MIKRTLLLATVGMFCVPALLAKTIITDENITKFENVVPLLEKLPKRSDTTEFVLQEHCDWPKHYSELKAQYNHPEDQQEIEKIVKNAGFTPAEFIELSTKLTWPILQMTQPMLQLSKQSLAFLGEAERKKVLDQIKSAENYTQVVSTCLTSYDKAALEQYKNRIVQKFSAMMTKQ